MAYNAIQDNIYNYYLTAYAPKSIGKYDAHKKGELRSLYNSMVKLNKESPLYLIHNIKESAQFAMGLKENARELRAEITSLGGDLDSSELLNRKAAYSSNENLATAKYIGDFSGEASSPVVEIGVQSLASAQTNLGNFLTGNAPITLPPDTYSFDIGINDMNYEFQFGIKLGETNHDIQNRLSRLINQSHIGLTSQVVDGENGTFALRIESEATGLKSGQDTIFTVTDDRTSKTSGMVSYLGIDFISHNASNAMFTVNGEAKEARSNSITLDRLYEIKLQGISTDENATSFIGLKTDYESVTDNVAQLAGSYNGFLKAVDDFQNLHSSSKQLKSEMSGITSIYKDNLHNIGLNVQEDGSIEVDREALSKAIHGSDAEDRFQVVKNFAQQIARKTNQISLNPMKYIDKTVVSYKNPGHNFTNPYTSSNYVGMLFNYYC